MAIEGAGNTGVVDPGTQGVTNTAVQPGAAPGSTQQPANSQQPQPGHQPVASPGTQPGDQSGQDDARYRGLIGDVQKERKARQQAESQLTELKNRFDEMDRRLKAAAGVPGDTDQARDKLREQFKQVFPEAAWLFDLTDEQREALRAAPSAINKVKEQEDREWAQRGHVYKEGVSEQIAEALSVEKLSEVQATQAHELFAGWFRDTVVKELDASDGEKSETLRRYQRNDQTLVTDFVKAWKANWVEPARRQAVAGNVNRASQRVPDSTGRNAVISAPNRPKQGASLDERLQFITDNLKEQGVQFGR